MLVKHNIQLQAAQYFALVSFNRLPLYASNDLTDDSMRYEAGRYGFTFDDCSYPRLIDACGTPRDLEVGIWSEQNAVRVIIGGKRICWLSDEGNQLSKLVNEAVYRQIERDQIKQMKLEELRRQIQIGMDASKRGEGVTKEEAVSKSAN